MVDLRQPPTSEGQCWQTVLLRGETLMWTGQPRRGLMLRPADALLVPFSLLWGGFAIFWNVMVWRAADWFFRLWGLPFLVAGLWLIGGRFFSDAWLRAHTRYAVTDRRVLIRTSLLPLQSLDRNRLPRLEMDEHKDGSVSLWFAERGSLFGWGRRRSLWSTAFDRTPHFERIAKGREVYDLLSTSNR